MAQKPLKIKDYQMNISSTRKELMDEENEKILGKRGFIFTTYKTEKQRIEEYLKEKDTINAKINLIQNKNNNYNDSHHNNNDSPPSNSKDKTKPSLAQPSMRFKARTDLERIAETVNKYNFGRADYHIINKQLKNLELNISKKIKDENEDEVIPDYASSLIKRIERHRDSEMRKEKEFLLNHVNNEQKHINSNNILVSDSDRKKKGKKKIDNSQARNLMSDLHIKTHFKGATGYMLFKDSSIPNNTIQREDNNINNYDYANMYNMFATITNTEQSTNYPTYYNCNTTRGSNIYNSTGNFKNKKNENFFGKTNTFNKTKNSLINKDPSTTNPKVNNKLNTLFNDQELSQEILSTNPLLYNLNEQPFKKNYEKENVDFEKLNFVKDLAFKKREDANLVFQPKMRNSSQKLLQVINHSSSSNSISPKKNLSGNELQMNNAYTNLVSKTSLRGSMIQHNPQTFLQRYKESLITGNDYEFKKSEEEKITIEGEEFYKSDIDKIARKVLTGCNFVHKKNKNNNTELACGDGKLMFTCGMTIKDFMKKHHLPS
jgi:hypothetical protein